tara:strand:+ start:809 stop:1039 length:231 start_codon:yes stop_codon:yes gene_type:complete
MARKRILVNPLNPNGIEVAFTAEEEAQAATDAANAVTRRAAEAEAKVASDANKASGKQKLKNLGLNDAEIKSLIGV